jgi:hypothetical protein
MNIDGHAFKKNADEIMARRRARHAEIKNTPGVELEKFSSYGRTQFTGTLTTPEAQALSEEDLALIADNGNLCFGGSCQKRGATFSGEYYTD